MARAGATCPLTLDRQVKTQARNQGEAAGPSPDRPQGWRFGGAWYNTCK